VKLHGAQLQVLEAGGRRALDHLPDEQVGGALQRPRLAVEDGALVKNARARLLESLRAPQIAGSPVWFATTSADPRSKRAQAELEAVFRRAGWQVRGTEVVDFRLKPGLFLFAAQDSAPGYLKRLNRALDGAGLAVGTFASGYRAYSQEMRHRRPGWRGFRLAPDQDYVLVVGRQGG
jgi:hypothetical protein